MLFCHCVDRRQHHSGFSVPFSVETTLNVIASSQVTGASPSEHDPTQSLRPAVDFPADSVRRCSQTDVRPRAETFVCLSPAASAPLSQHVWLHRCRRVLRSFISHPADCYFSFYGSLQETWIIRVTRQTNKDTLVTLQVQMMCRKFLDVGGQVVKWGVHWYFLNLNSSLYSVRTLFWLTSISDQLCLIFLLAAK